MKLAAILALLLLLALPSEAQEPPKIGPDDPDVTNIATATAPEGLVRPVRISGPKARYTKEARKAKLQGTVVVGYTVTKRGRVTDAEVLRGLEHGLSKVALRTMKAARYQPATLDGEPVAVYMAASVKFSMPKVQMEDWWTKAKASLLEDESPADALEQLRLMAEEKSKRPNSVELPGEYWYLVALASYQDGLHKQAYESAVRYLLERGSNAERRPETQALLKELEGLGLGEESRTSSNRR